MPSVAAPPPDQETIHARGHARARRHHHRPLLRRPLRRPDRRPAGGHGDLLQGGRRLPHQHRDRHSAPGTEERHHHPRRRRAHGPLHPRATAARGRRRRGLPHRSQPPHRPGDPGRARPEDLSADLLSRQLRRRRARHLRHRRGVCRQRGRDRGHRYAFRPARRVRGADEGDRLCPQARPQGGVRRRLPPQSLGPRRPWRGRGTLHQVGRGDRPACPRTAALRRDRRHRGGADDRRRGGRAAGRHYAPSASRAAPSSCASAARWAA